MYRVVKLVSEFCGTGFEYRYDCVLPSVSSIEEFVDLYGSRLNVTKIPNSSEWMAYHDPEGLYYMLTPAR